MVYRKDLKSDFWSVSWVVKVVTGLTEDVSSSELVSYLR